MALTIVPQEETIFRKDAVITSDGVAGGTGLEPGLVPVGGGDGFFNKVTVLQAAAHNPGSRNAVEMMRGGGENGRGEAACFMENGRFQHIEFAGLFAAHIEQEQLLASRWIDGEQVLEGGELVARISVKQNHLIQHTSHAKPHQTVLVLGECDGEKTAVWQRMNRVDKPIGRDEKACWFGVSWGYGLGRWFGRAEGT